MKNHRKSIFAAAYLLFFMLTAQLSAMIECQRLHEILPLIDEDTLVVFNINNVLTVSLQDAGSTPWAEEHIARIADEKKISKAHATNLFIPFWHDILIASDVELFDPEAEAVVRYLQSKNIKVMALTNRYTEMGYPTHRNLRSVGIDFAKNPPYPEDFFIQNTESPAKYIEGIIFNGLINFKGDSLAAFLKQIHFFPKKIVYIEDKPKHLAQVEKVITDLGISFIGVHFGALDLERQSYNSDLAKLQVQYHFDILDDASAQKICNRLQKNPSPQLEKPKESLSSLPPNVWKIQDFKQIEQDLVPHTLVVTELDHVLWHTQGSIGSREFLEHLERRNVKFGYTNESARAMAELLFEKIHRRAQVRLIDDYSPYFLKKIAERCWSVAISYRPATLLNRTLEQAHELELHFNSPFIVEKAYETNEIICTKKPNSQFSELKQKISLMASLPASIIGISSTLSDLIELQNIANTFQLPFKGYLYSSPACHGKENILNEDILSLELELLQRLMTNEEATELLKKSDE